MKICGMNSAAAVQAAVAAGADAVGFVFAPSPRQVSPAQAVELAALVPPGLLRVAVMRHPSLQQWQEVAAEFRPDWLQTDAADFERLTLPANVERLPVYRDIPQLDAGAMAREGRILFESADSGAGCAPDWHRARAIARQAQVLLAGGLDPGNVAEAIRQVRPWGVDVSSGVESVRGVKDPAKIAAFVAAVRRAERELGDVAH